MEKNVDITILEMDCNYRTRLLELSFSCHLLNLELKSLGIIVKHSGAYFNDYMDIIEE